MRSGIFFAGFVGLMLACARSDPPVTSFDDPLAARPDPGAWVLTFDDEFDQAAVDSSKWFLWTGDLQHKGTVNSASPSMAAVRDGSLFVSARPTPEDKAFPFTTGYADTRGLFAQTYGKIEFRARAAYAPGVWYALWGRSWTHLVPEIDVELLAENINQAWFVNHWGVVPLPADERRGFTTVDGLDITEKHTFTIVWTPALIEWQIDGKAFRRVTDPAHVPHEPMFWVANAWVGGWGGTPGASTIFPASLEVEYLRIYRLAEWATDPVIRVVDPRPKVAQGGEIAVELADFDAGAGVEVWEGSELVGTLAKPPFRFQPKALTRAAHTLRFVATDGARTATTSLDVTID